MLKNAHIYIITLGQLQIIKSEERKGWRKRSKKISTNVGTPVKNPGAKA
jgi:hypothetical protein